MLLNHVVLNLYDEHCCEIRVVAEESIEVVGEKKNQKSCKEKLKNQTKNIKISYLINNTTIGNVIVDIMLLHITKLVTV